MTSYLLPCISSPFWKEVRVYSKRKEFAPKVNKSFSFRVYPFSERDKNFDSVVFPKVHQFSLSAKSQQHYSHFISYLGTVSCVYSTHPTISRVVPSASSVVLCKPPWFLSISWFLPAAVQWYTVYRLHSLKQFMHLQLKVNVRGIGTQMKIFSGRFSAIFTKMTTLWLHVCSPAPESPSERGPL